MIARLEPVISEMEREGESIVIVGHQAVLRVIFGYLMAQVGWLVGWFHSESTVDPQLIHV
jgi:broad specificity phosphatase PhoE